MAGGPDPDAARPSAAGGAGSTRGSGCLGGLILAVMTLAVFVQVRAAASSGLAGIDGLDEIPRYLFVWLVMIGAAAAMHRGEHTRLEYFERPPRPARTGRAHRA